MDDLVLYELCAPFGKNIVPQVSATTSYVACVKELADQRLIDFLNQNIENFLTSLINGTGNLKPPVDENGHNTMLLLKEAKKKGRDIYSRRIFGPNRAWFVDTAISASKVNPYFPPYHLEYFELHFVED